MFYRPISPQEKNTYNSNKQITRFVFSGEIGMNNIANTLSSLELFRVNAPLGCFFTYRVLFYEFQPFQMLPQVTIDDHYFYDDGKYTSEQTMEQVGLYSFTTRSFEWLLTEFLES